MLQSIQNSQVLTSPQAYFVPVALEPDRAEARLLEQVPTAKPLVLRVRPVVGDATLGFGSIAPLVARALSWAEADPENKEFLQSIAAELTWLFPELRSKEFFKAAPELTEIAIAPSRRRLHKESEQILRVTVALGRLLRKWLCSDECEIGIVHAVHVDGIDEQSVRVMRRVADIMPEGGPLILFSRGGEFKEPVVEGLTPWLGQKERRAAMLEGVMQNLKHVVLDQDARSPVSALEIVEIDGIANLGTREKALVEALNTSIEENDQPETLAAHAISAIEEAVFTLNFPQARAILGQIGGRFVEFSPKQQHELVLHLAFAEAFACRFESAAEALQYAMSLADRADEKAMSHFFLALLKIKRLGQPLQGREHLDHAIAMLKDRTDDAALNDLAWLYNLRALSFVELRDVANARKQVLMGIKYNKACKRTPDSIHLKINLLSNMTNLEEFTRQVPKAIERWSVFEPMLKSAAGSFAKHYHYRMGGLLTKVDRFDEASDHFMKAYAEARKSHDLFYAVLIARDLGGVLYRAGQVEEAARWFEACVRLQDEMGADDAISADWVALWYCRWCVTSKTAGANAVKQPLYKSISSGSMGHEGEDQSGANAFAPVEFQFLPRPGTKLNRPFDITNLYWESAS